MYIIIGFTLLTLLTTPSVLVRSARVASLAMKGEARISSLVHYALTAQTLIQLHVAPHRKQLNEQLPKLRSNATCIQRIESDCRITRYIIMKGERAYRTRQTHRTGRSRRLYIFTLSMPYDIGRFTTHTLSLRRCRLSLRSSPMTFMTIGFHPSISAYQGSTRRTN